MKRYNKKLSLLIVLAMMFTMLFTGCDSKDKGDVTKISVWTGNMHSKAFYDREVAKFNETIGKEKGIEIEYVVKNDLSSQIDLALANDAAPDIFSTVSSIRKVAGDGKIMAYDDIPELSDLLKKYESYKEYNGFDDKTYALPDCCTTFGLIYNPDLFKKAGIVDSKGEAKPPETWDELVAAAEKLTGDGNYGIIFPVKMGKGWVSSQIVNAAQASCGNVGYDPVSGKYDYSSVKPIMDAFLKIKDNKWCYPGMDSIDNDVARARFALGNIGMIFGASYDVGVYTDQFPVEFDWKVAPIPVTDINNRYKQNMTIVNNYYINKKTFEERGSDKISTVINWLLSDDLLVKRMNEGYNIAVGDTVDKIDLSSIKSEQWKAFIDLQTISNKAPLPHAVELGNDKNVHTLLLEDAWSGNMSVDEAILKANKNYEAGMKRRIEVQPDYDSSKSIQKSWDIRIK